MELGTPPPRLAQRSGPLSRHLLSERRLSSAFCLCWRANSGLSLPDGWRP